MEKEVRFEIESSNHAFFQQIDEDKWKSPLRL
jgi:hypothetical protein